MKTLNDLIGELILLRKDYGNLLVFTSTEIGYGESAMRAPSPVVETFFPTYRPADFDEDVSECGGKFILI